MRVTCGNGNKRNRIKGSLVRVYADSGELVGEINIPSRQGLEYIERWPKGKYAAEYRELVKKCQEMEKP